MNRIQFIKAKIHTIQNSVKLRWLIAASFLAFPVFAFLFIALAPIIDYDIEGHYPNLQSFLVKLLFGFILVFNQICTILSTILFFSLLITHTKMSFRKYLLLLACYAYPAIILGGLCNFDLQKLAMYYSNAFILAREQLKFYIHFFIFGIVQYSQLLL